MRERYRRWRPEWLGRQITTWRELRRLRGLRYYEDGKSSGRIFDQKQCIFVHVPKTGGVSVAQALFGNAASAHWTIDECRVIFGARLVEQYYTFTFVRNPWDRLVSAYNYLSRGGMHDKDARYWHEHLAQYADFTAFVREWLKPENLHLIVHMLPQNHFVCGKSGQLDLDFVGYFESFNADYEALREQVGFGKPLAHLNQSRSSKPYTEWYTDETRQIVAEIYRKDLELFGYDFANEHLAENRIARPRS